jgi:hypothetical protein
LTLKQAARRIAELPVVVNDEAPKGHVSRIISRETSEQPD